MNSPENWYPIFICLSRFPNSAYHLYWSCLSERPVFRCYFCAYHFFLLLQPFLTKAAHKLRNEKHKQPSSQKNWWFTRVERRSHRQKIEFESFCLYIEFRFFLLFLIRFFVRVLKYLLYHQRWAVLLMEQIVFVAFSVALSCNCNHEKQWPKKERKRNGDGNSFQVFWIVCDGRARKTATTQCTRREKNRQKRQRNEEH